MKLLDYCNKNYESRAKCAEALGVSIFHFNNLIAKKTEVAKLASGEWMVLTKYNKIFTS